MAWSGCSSGIYSTFSACKWRLQEHVEDEEGSIFLHLRNFNIPNKVKFLIWRAMGYRLPTRDNLGRRNINVNQDDLLCPFCRQCYETQDHLFLSCEVTRKAWSACYLWLSPDFVTVASNNLIRDIAGNIWI